MELFQNKVKLEVHQIKEDNNVYIQSLSPIARSLGIDFNNDITKLYDSLVQKLEVQTGCRLSWNSYQNIESQDFIFEIKPPIRLLKYSSTYIMDVYDSTFPTNIFGNIKSKYKKYTGEWIPNEIKGTAIRAGGSCQNFINTKSAHIRATHLKYGLEFGEIFTELNETLKVKSPNNIPLGVPVLPVILMFRLSIYKPTVYPD